MLVCRTKTPSYLALGYNVGRTTLHASKPQWAAAAVAAFRPAKNMSTTLCLDIVYLRAGDDNSGLLTPLSVGRKQRKGSRPWGRGLSLVSSPLHAMKSPSQIQSSAAVKFGGVTDCNVSDNSPEQEATTGHSIPRRLDSPTSQATQLPKLELTLTPTTGHATTFSDGKPASETSELNPEDVTVRLEDMEVEIDTLHADTDNKELLISELQDSLAAAENEIALLQIRVADAKDRHAEDHDQIQPILAHLGL
ncbi:hypothetical protein Tco_0706023 [Tanacetum coccineum]|uniref:Uncharacterized protein n=1 Tax=Tanacetum coccineum TaxID=301880 RepID=A0ABQ4Y8C4_9ASTR